VTYNHASFNPGLRFGIFPGPFTVTAEAHEQVR
jgi:hypothetical protein